MVVVVEVEEEGRRMVVVVEVEKEGRRMGAARNLLWEGG